MAYFIIIRGPLGAGKTTIAKRLAKRINAAYISIDELLAENKLDVIEGPCIPAKNFIKANELILPKARAALNKGKAVIFDGNFYHKEQIDHLIKNLPVKHFVFTLKTNLNVCIARDANRKKVHGEAAAKAVHKLISKVMIGTVVETKEKTEEQILDEILSKITE